MIGQYRTRPKTRPKKGPGGIDKFLGAVGGLHESSISASAGASSEQLAVHPGLNDWLSKPVRLDVLARRPLSIDTVNKRMGSAFLCVVHTHNNPYHILPLSKCRAWVRCKM